jgi:hypothetical protein
MRRVVLVVALVVALAAASTALAAYQYAPPQQWSPGAKASTPYSPNWLANNFRTYGSGTDKSVTFINNWNYGWHNTKRGGSDYLETYPPYPGTFKAHCVSHSWFWGSCNVR